MALNTQALDATVAKFRKASPNIAAAFDETKKLLVQIDTRVTALEETEPLPPPTPPPSGNVLEFAGTVSAAMFIQALNTAPAGPLTVRPTAGQGSFTVSGDFTLSRRDVTIQHAVLRDVGWVTEAGSGFTVEDSTVHSFLINGADGWTIRRTTIAFNGVSYNGYGGSVMNGASNWKILNNRITGAYVAANPSQHTEAWFIGAGNDGGLIQGNTFDDNGSTGHIFFSWWDFHGGNRPHPKNVCVTGNTFTKSRNPYWHIDMRPELDWSSNNIDIDPATNSWDKPHDYTKLAAIDAAVRPC